MPVTFKDRDGREIEGASVSIAGGSCFGCTVVIFLAIVGLGALISAATGLPL